MSSLFRCGKRTAGRIYPLAVIRANANALLGIALLCRIRYGRITAFVRHEGF